MTILQSIILGTVEGLTEFLPVSSTGHLLVAQYLLDCRQSDAFNVLIQIGPIVAVTLVFWRHILSLITGFMRPETRDEGIKLLACFCMTGAGGLAVKKLGMELPETMLPVAIATLVGAPVIFFAEYLTKHKTLSGSVSWPVAAAVAAGQVLAALFPGTSRSGAAVIAALLLGTDRPAAVRFAFLVGIPTMFAAGGLQLKEAMDAGQAAALMAPEALIAAAVATVTAWVSVVWLIRFVQKRTFVPFAWYRLVLGTALIALTFTRNG